MASGDRQAKWRAFNGPLAVALVALFAVLLTLDAAGDYPWLGEGPGVTLDESFNVQMGVYQWNALCEYHVALLHPDSVREVFGPGSNYNPDHPPLGRLWLGFCHDLVKWLAPPADCDRLFVTDCARVGSATAFALTVFVIGVFATKWYGRASGIVAAVSLVLMPRVFAHAHLASLETFLNLTYSVAVLSVAHWWGRSAETSEVSKTSEVCRTRLAIPARRVCVFTGALFGLVLLTKIQAILIPPVVGLWALWHWRTRAIKPLAIFVGVGLLVFFAGWPWLWLDPVGHFREFFARTTSRAVLNCYYLGQVWADKDVPWHYSFVMFAVTVPVGLQVLGLLGVFGQGRAWRQPREQLVLAATLFPLLLFALPGVAVYDGERLFLVSFPLWAVLIGRGSGVALSYLERGQAFVRSSAFRRRIHNTPPEGGTTNLSFFASERACCWYLTLWLLPQCFGVIAMHPCQLSYYNLLVGGLSGADRLGFERTYWGDSLTRSTLAEIAESGGIGATLVVDPVLHQFQLKDLEQQSGLLRRNQSPVISAEAAKRFIQQGKTVYRVEFCRKADLPKDHWDVAQPEQEHGLRRNGVLLSRWWSEPSNSP